MRTTVIAIRLMIVTAVLLGLVYPLLMTGAAHVLFPSRADGSLVKVNGKVVGSSLIAQDFTGPGYFHPRPSAADYNAMASSAANLGPTSRMLRDQVRTAVIQAIRADPGLRLGGVPIDMVTSSGSGLDPDITVANARAQAPRVALARHLSLATVMALVSANTTGRQFGFLGEPRVNVLALNLALDHASGGTVAER